MKKRLLSLLLVFLMVIQVTAGTASAAKLVTDENASNIGQIVRYSEVDASNKIFKLDVYIKGGIVGSSFGLSFRYDTTKMDLYDPSTTKAIITVDVLGSLALESAKHTASSLGEQKIDHSTFGWVNFLTTALSPTKGTIETAIGLSTNTATMGSFWTEITNQKEGYDGYVLDTADDYLLYSVYFKAKDNVALKDIAANDFDLAEPTVNINGAWNGLYAVVMYAPTNKPTVVKDYDVLFTNFPGDQEYMDITSAALTVIAPAFGATPGNANTSEASYTVSETAWTDSSGNTVSRFAYGEPYTVTATLTPEAGYQFTNSTTATVNGQNATVQLNDNGMLTVTYKFAALSAPTIKLDVNGGDTLSEDTVTVTNDSKYPTLPTPTRTGYTFDGWYTEQTGGEQKQAGEIYSGTTNSTLYAHWSQNTYAVTVNHYWLGADGTEIGTQLSENVNAGSGQEYQAPSISGYTYAGYKLGDGQSQAGDSVTVTAAATINFYYKKDVTVTVNGTTESKTYTGSEQTVTGFTFSGAPAGYKVELVPGKATEAKGITVGDYAMGLDDSSFQLTGTNPGWYSVTWTVTDGKLTITEAEITEVAVASIDAPVAGEKPDTSATVDSGANYTVSDVSWQPVDSTFAYGTAYTVKVTLNAKDNYKFAAQDNISATVNGEAAASKIVSDDGKTLTLTYTFPKTAEEIFTVIKGDVPHGDISIDKTTAKAGETVTVTLTPNNGYEYDSLTSSVNGVDFTKISDTTCTFTMPSSNVTVGANFKAIPYTISYQGLDGATVNPANPTNYTVESQNITLTNPAKEGYDFLGWSGTELTGDANKNVTIPAASTGDREYTAHWEIKTYTVTLTEGTGYELAAEAGSSSPVNHGGSYSFTLTLKDGYTGSTPTVKVNGTAINANNDGVYTISNITENKTVTVEGVWRTTYTITFKNGDVIVETKTVDHGGTLLFRDFPAVPAKTGYTGAWNVTSDITNVTADQTVNANYTPNKYTVTFNYQGATDGNSTNNKSVTYDSLYGTLPTPTKTGANFLGWFTEQTGGSKVEENTQVTTAVDHTLYAHWSDKQGLSIDTNTQPFTYGDSGIGFTVKPDPAGISGFKVEYQVNNSWTESVPTDAGTYNVKVTRAEDGNYAAFTQEVPGGLKINPKALTVTGVNGAISKTYDGNTTVTSKPTLEFTGVVGNDAVILTYNGAAYDNKDAGTGKAVTFSGISVSGAAAGNYTVDSTYTASDAGTITALPVVITWDYTKAFIYDKQEHTVTPSITNTVAGDVVSITTVTGNTGRDYQDYTAQVTALGGDDAGNYTLTEAIGTELNWKIVREKLIGITAPSGKTLDRQYSSAAEVIATLPTTVDATTESGSTTLDITWKLKDGETFDNSTGGSNTYVWTATVPDILDPNGVSTTGEITVNNQGGSAAPEGSIAGQTSITLSSNTSANTTTLTVNLTQPTDTTGITCQWQKWNGNSWENISGETGDTLTLSNLTTADNGAQYRCIVTNTESGKAPAASNIGPVTLTVQKGTQNAPNATATHPSTIGGTGSITDLTTAMQISTNGGQTWSNVDDDQASNGISGIQPGATYQIRYAETEYLQASPAQIITINAYNPGQELTPNAQIDYEQEQLIGLEANTDYTIDGSKYTADNEGKIAILESWLNSTLSIVKPGNGSTTTDSPAQQLLIPARPQAPSVTAVNESYSGAKDGKITGVNDTMEYSTDSGITWTKITGTELTDLGNGAYLVRVAASNSKQNFRSSATTVNVGSDEAKLTDISITTPPDKTGYYEGEAFDRTGMVVTATYSDGTSKTVTGYTCDPSGALAKDQTSITVTYTEGGVTKTAQQSITVTVKPQTAYTVTVNGSYAATSGAGQYTAGTVVTIQAGSRSGYTFTGWTTSDGVTLSDANSAVATFTMPAKSVTVTANWRSNGGGGTTTYYTLTFVSNGGSSVDPIRRPAGTKITLNQTTERSGYIFTGWYLDEALTQKADSVTLNRNMKVYAGWQKDIADPENTGVSALLNTDDHLKYLSGYSNGTFGPNRNMTRAEAAQMFYNLLRDRDVPITVQFSDVPENAWYANAVNTLASLGIILGYSDGSFGPYDYITRAQFTVIAMRFAKLDTSGQNIFSDVSEGAWYYNYVVGSIKYGWIGGYSDGTFRPNATITRAQVTAITNRLLGRNADVGYINSHTDDLKNFSDVKDSYWAYYDIMEATNSHDYSVRANVERWTATK